MLLTYLRQLVLNDVLWVSIVTSSLAQFLKPFTAWVRTREFDWRHLADTGGMPSSHSALICAVATGVGIEQGFDSAYFAISVVVAMIVTYDAAGVRRQAGQHAYVINQIIVELLRGHPIQETHLKEVLGHSRTEVAAGIFFGIATMLLWKFAVQPLFLP